MKAGAYALPLALTLLSGCATALVQGGQIREEPFAELVARTAAARGNPRPAEVDARVVRQDEVPALLRASIAHEWSPEEMARYQERLVAIGLWPPDRDLLDETLRVAREEIAGFYLPESGVLYAVEDVDAPFSVRFFSWLMGRDLMREAVLAHELVHLLQHRAQPAAFEAASWQEQDDAAAAVQAAIEGDATHYGFLALLPPGGESYLPDPAETAAAMEAEIAAKQDGALADAPALVRLTLAFPYSRGYPLSHAEGVTLLDAPPASTEQVLHPELRHAEFALADLAPLEPSLPAGCASLGQNTLGELGIWVLLSDFGLGERAASASAGWDGDRYLAARCGAARAFLWWTSWDSETDALEFAAAYGAVADAVAERAGLAAAPRLVRSGSEVWIASAPLAPASGPLAPEVPGGLRRTRGASLDELRAFFGLDASGAVD